MKTTKTIKKTKPAVKKASVSKVSKTKAIDPKAKLIPVEDNPFRKDSSRYKRFALMQKGMTVEDWAAKAKKTPYGLLRVCIEKGYVKLS
ncbi:MAG: hypothetical protein JXR49_09460 [Acidobacteria bacterium]|nr:hypothetical protein [Acidobacteriota bacterium]